MPTNYSLNCLRQVTYRENQLLKIDFIEKATVLNWKSYIESCEIIVQKLIFLRLMGKISVAYNLKLINAVIKSFVLVRL